VNQAAVTNAQISQEQLGLAREQWANTQERQAAFDPKFQALIDQSIATQDTANQRSAQLWDSYTQNFAPLEAKMAATAAGYDTEGRRAQEAATARATVDTQFAAQRASQNRGLERAGVSLSSGRGATLDAASRYNASKAAAGADIGARRAVEATGINLVGNAVNVGRGLPALSQVSTGQGLQAGQGATGQLATQQSTYNSAFAPSMGLYSGATGANTAAGNLYGQAAAIQAQSQGTGLAGLMGLGQLAGTMYGSGMFSSKELKTPVRRSLADVEDAKITSETPTADAVSRVAPRSWRYKPGLGDSAVHVGPYAEDVQREMGDGAAPGGKMLDVGAMAHMNMRAIMELSRHVDALAYALDRRAA